MRCVARCSHSGGPLSGSQVPIADARSGIDAANRRMGEKGLRVLAFAARLVDDDELSAMAEDPMSLTRGLAFVGMAVAFSGGFAAGVSPLLTGVATGVLPFALGLPYVSIRRRVVESSSKSLFFAFHAVEAEVVAGSSAGTR